ncbi:MAG TPA: hypothetical protein VF334_13800, partial [Polyangia bacterium]
MRPPALLLLVCGLAACHAKDPTWATAPTGAAEHRGEPTIAGEPLAVPKLPVPPVVDGKLDDAAWAGAAVLGPLVDPGTGQPLPTSP